MHHATVRSSKFEKVDTQSIFDDWPSIMQLLLSDQARQMPVSKWSI